MRLINSHNIIALLIFFDNLGQQYCLEKIRLVRNVGGSKKGISAPLLNNEIDLKTVEGIEQATKLVLMKTDSLPDKFDDRIDGRYLSSLLETLYTGLRKPFKSVSADILGIFPTFEEIQVNCDRTNGNQLEKDETLVSSSINEFVKGNATKKRTNSNDFSKTTERGNETVTLEGESYQPIATYKSSVRVCQAVTKDCLSMEELVQILPSSITTFDKALVRLCPVMLFRIMNNICPKPTAFMGEWQQDESNSLSQPEKIIDETESSNQKKESMSLNSLLRETKLLKNIQNSDDSIAKKPQKLHKKLKTQTPFNANERFNAVGLQQQHGSVDEQLLKIRLKLTEPSIEKVWIFSLLFVILSIVVSMGGLIVLPFVKKTTRRRILTLFEGLAVGGLSGSATLHMFPQAFGLVDENYHKYFWRIFVVFFGIYLCYLCERIIKIFKVMKVKMERRSRASLLDIDMDLRYGLPSFSFESRRSKSKSSRICDFDQYETIDESSRSFTMRKKDLVRLSRNRELGNDCLDSRSVENKSFNRFSISQSDLNKPPVKSRIKKYTKRKPINSPEGCEETSVTGKRFLDLDDSENINRELMGWSSIVEGQAIETRHRLRQCLDYVQRQFSPVYAVQTPVVEPIASSKDDTRDNRFSKDSNSRERVNFKKIEREQEKLRKNRVEPSSIFRRIQNENKYSKKKHMKQRDIETMLYHRSMDIRNGRNAIDDVNQRLLQQRLSTVSDVAAERQDQDNAARMSVDTVAWMIVFGDAVLNVIDGLSIGAAFERNILAGISISVAVMLEEVTHRLGTFAVLIRAGMSMQQSLLCTFLSACALFPGLIVGILLSDATEDATPYIFCAAGGIFLYMALVDVMKEMNRSIENAIRKDIRSTLQIFALQNVGIILAVIFLSFLALYEQAMDFEEYQMQYNQLSN